MISILLIALFISQLISFFFIILLNMKIAKFKDVEIRQEKVIREMDDAIGMYLMEMKEENDRLIQELTTVERVRAQPSPIFAQEPVYQAEREQDIFVKPVTPVAIAATFYSKQKQGAEVRSVEAIAVETKLAPFEQHVLALYGQGLSIEEIAKKTQKGKTEIELLIKFHS